MASRKKLSDEDRVTALAPISLGGGDKKKKGSGNEINKEALKKEIEAEQKAKESIEWNNMELERSVRAMEMNVLQLEAGNMDADDSEVKQKYENQKQLNVQLLEQKRWLEHELEQIKQKIQNEKMDLPDPFSFDWDNLSETELKRLVGQLEKTRSDLRSDLTEMEWRLDKEGKEFHHYDEFYRMYQAEIKNLNRIVESLMRTGLIPPGFQLPTSQSLSQTSSFPSTGMHTPGQPSFPAVAAAAAAAAAAGGHRGKSSSLSPPPGRRGLGVNRSGGGGPQPSSPTRRRNPSPPGKAVASDRRPAAAKRSTANVRTLPKIERGSRGGGNENGRNGGGGGQAGELRTVAEDQEH